MNCEQRSQNSVTVIGLGVHYLLNAFLFRVQLCVCISHIVKHDFPGRWTNLADKIVGFIQSDDPKTLMGALLSLYQLVKVYE